MEPLGYVRMAEIYDRKRIGYGRRNVRVKKAVNVRQLVDIRKVRCPLRLHGLFEATCEEIRSYECNIHQMRVAMCHVMLLFSGVGNSDHFMWVKEGHYRP
jgi:hypothetical protein